MPKKYYVVWAGRETGIFDSWEECKSQIDSFPAAKYKSFPSREQAIEAYRGDPAEHLNIFRAIANRKAEKVNYDAIPEIRQNAIAVDGACSGNPGKMEYRGVIVATGSEAFHFGPLDGGTNNIAEFLALVHALAWLDQQKRPDIPIYTDSRTALAWLRNRKAKTTLKPGPNNARIMNLIQRAETWLNNHPYPKNPVLKWDTENWGEIPADFGRK